MDFWATEYFKKASLTAPEEPPKLHEVIAEESGRPLSRTSRVVIPAAGVAAGAGVGSLIGSALPTRPGVDDFLRHFHD